MRMHIESNGTARLVTALAALVLIGSITEDEAIAALERAAHERSMRNTWAPKAKMPRWH